MSDVTALRGRPAGMEDGRACIPLRLRQKALHHRLKRRLLPEEKRQRYHMPTGELYLLHDGMPRPLSHLTLLAWTGWQQNDIARRDDYHLLAIYNACRRNISIASSHGGRRGL